jgi:hypothetical protein
MIKNNNDSSNNYQIIINNENNINNEDTIDNENIIIDNENIIINNENNIDNERIIKHIVISGGGPVGFTIYGSAKYLSKIGFWDISNIKTIYGTSIGAYIGVILSLKYDWDVLDEYFIKRPWEKLINISPESIFDIWSSKGFLGQEFIREAIRPLLEAKDLSINITLQELFEYNNIEIHMYSLDINVFPLEVTDISYKTHGSIKLIDALYMSSAAPFMFKPYIVDNSCFIDGGVINNHPINQCLNQTNCNPSEILSFKCILSINTEFGNSNNKIITNETTLYNYWVYMMKLFIKYINIDSKNPIIVNTVNCILNDVDNYNDWINILSEKSSREKYIKTGENYGYIFYKFKKSCN